MNILQKQFEDALKDTYDDRQEYIADKRKLEQPLLDYYFEQLKGGPDEATKRNLMYDAIEELKETLEYKFPEFIEILNLDPEFPLKVEYQACGCEVCNHINLLMVEVYWKAGAIPTNTLE